MKRFRRRPLGVRIAILAMLALLWSQVVLAGHPACSMGSMALAQVEAGNTVATDEGAHPCHQQAPASERTPPVEDAVCAAHCGQGSLSNDFTRVPAFPALPAAVPQAIVAFVFLPADPVRHHAWPPPVSWHRPTAHPAALLLI